MFEGLFHPMHLLVLYFLILCIPFFLLCRWLSLPWAMPSFASWRKIAITPTDPDFGEQTAQACANA